MKVKVRVEFSSPSLGQVQPGAVLEVDPKTAHSMVAATVADYVEEPAAPFVGSGAGRQPSSAPVDPASPPPTASTPPSEPEQSESTPATSDSAEAPTLSMPATVDGGTSTSGKSRKGRSSGRKTAKPAPSTD